MKRSKEDLEYFSSKQNDPEEKEGYYERPLFHHIFAWILIAIVLFAFLGVCYWMVNYGRV